MNGDGLESGIPYSGIEPTVFLASPFCPLKERADLSGILVQVNHSVIKDSDRVGVIVGNISRYTNSQNKLNEADLLANDAFHVKVEQLSRTVWAPCRAAANRETKWFYERARGQYSDEKGRRRTPAQFRLFEAEYPSSQWFTKTDLAKFENTWGEHPHLVSRGGQKNFAEFTLRLGARKGFVPDVAFFHELVGKAILFRAAEKIVSAQQFGGYRANIVTYTLAWIVHHAGGGIDLQKIWAQQGLDQQLSDLVTAACPPVHRLIIDSGGVNVTEWCKSDVCWARIRANDLGLSSPWKRVLQQWRESKVSGHSEENGEAVERVIALGAELWFSLARWARETRSLEGWQRTVASGISRSINSRKRPSAKQAEEGERALAEARKKGFRLPVP